MNKYLLTVLLVLFTTTSAIGDGFNKKNHLNSTKLYKVYWSGIHVADLIINIENDSIFANIESYGIVKKVSKYRSSFKSQFEYNNDHYKPISYYTEFEMRNGSKTINIQYSPDGTIKNEVVTPPDKRSKRPAVKDILKNNSADPLTAFMISRQLIKENLAKNNTKFSLNIYDGRRLSRLDFQIHGKYERKINESIRKIVKVSFKRIAIDGYTQNELRRMPKEEPLFTLYLSDDETLLPLKADAEAKLGTAVILYEKDCISFTACKL
jgi:hypothetical protein